MHDPKLIPDVAVLDPCLTVNMPKHLTATTGMDALTHAVEAYTNIFSGPTDRGAKYAVRLIFRYLPQVYRDGDEIAAREKMLEASYEAGVAFTRSCVGYVHAIAHTLGGLYGTPHGLANAVILPHILELYGKAVYKPLAELADAADISGNSDREKAENFIGAIRQMNKDMDIPEHLEIKDEDIPKMIKWAIVEANPVYPVPVIWNEADFRKAIDKIRGKI
ncbi:MAG: iron-containing alcohol dehydrogenase [Clostridia bacterium]|nr:iron-containing alcohol dehydrogenase [Clostridia bacterium]